MTTTQLFSQLPFLLSSLLLSLLPFPLTPSPTSPSSFPLNPLTSSRYRGLSGSRKYSRAPRSAGNAESAINNLQLWNLLMVSGRMTQAKPPQTSRPKVQKNACAPMYGPRYLLRVNSAMYGNMTGRDPPTLHMWDTLHYVTVSMNIRLHSVCKGLS